jgi:uncharacterized protein (DUF1778 family)
MYTKDKNKRITLRLNEEQFGFVQANAEILGVSPSDFLRMVINTSLATSKTHNAKVVLERKDIGDCRANEETHIDNIV